MRLFLQFTDGLGVIHEIPAPAFYVGGTVLASEMVLSRTILTIDTAAGPARIEMPTDYDPAWTLTGYRQE